MKNIIKKLIVSWWLILWWQWLDASTWTVWQSHMDELNGKEKKELVANLAEKVEAWDKEVYDEVERLRMDSINAIPFNSINQEFRVLVEKRVHDMDNWKLNKYYWHEEYLKEAKKIQKEYKEKVKELKLNETVFKCGEKKFDKKMDEVEQEIMANPDKYGSFSSEWKFVVNVEEYKNLIHDKFPEFWNDDLFDSYLKYDDSGQYTRWDAAREWTEIYNYEKYMKSFDSKLMTNILMTVIKSIGRKL